MDAQASILFTFVQWVGYCEDILCGLPNFNSNIHICFNINFSIYCISNLFHISCYLRIVVANLQLDNLNICVCATCIQLQSLYCSSAICPGWTMVLMINGYLFHSVSYDQEKKKEKLNRLVKRNLKYKSNLEIRWRK